MRSRIHLHGVFPRHYQRARAVNAGGLRNICHLLGRKAVVVRKAATIQETGAEIWLNRRRFRRTP